MPHNNKSAVNERRQKLWTLLTKGMKGIAKVLSSPARKAAINIEYPALHPIATGWSNISFIHSILYKNGLPQFVVVVRDKATPF